MGVVLQTIFPYRSVFKHITKGVSFLHGDTPACKPFRHTRWRYHLGRPHGFPPLPLAKQPVVIATSAGELGTTLYASLTGELHATGVGTGKACRAARRGAKGQAFFRGAKGIAIRIGEKLFGGGYHHSYQREASRGSVPL